MTFEEMKKEYLKIWNEEYVRRRLNFEKALAWEEFADFWIEKLKEKETKHQSELEALAVKIIDYFKSKCVVNKDGDCKYFDRLKCGYSETDDEFVFDKFFPQDILNGVLEIIRQAKEKV